MRNVPPRPTRRRAPRNEGLSTQAQMLYADVVRRSGDVQEQLLLLLSLARNHAASSGDVAAVRELLVAGHTRECAG